MPRGLSPEQRTTIAILSRRGTLTTDELLAAMEREATALTRRSMIRTLRRLEARGLVRLTRLPGRGHGRIAATANPGAAGELRSADLHRAKRAERG